MEIKRDTHSVYEIGYHIVFCTKYRRDVLVGDIETVCRNVLAQTCVAYEWQLHDIEIMPDHVHMFISAKPNVSPMEIAKTLKSISAITLFREFPVIKRQKFWGSGMWSPSTYFGTVGHVSAETISRYIQDQKKRI